MRSDRFQVIGNAPGWSCILRESERLTLEVHHSMPKPPVSLGYVIPSKDGYRLAGIDFSHVRGTSAYDLAKKAWIVWAKRRGIREVTVNRYPANPETFAF